MHAEGVIQELDYIRSQYLHIRPRRVLAAIGVMILALFVWARVASPSWVMSGVVAYPVLWLLVFTVLWLLVFIVLWLLVFIPWRAKRNYRQYKALSEPVSVEVREDGLFFKRDNGESLVPWSHIIRWRQGKKLLLLYPTSNIFYLIPSHFFPTHETYTAFVEVVKGQVGNAT